MIGFWISAAILIAAVVAVIVLGLRRPQQDTGPQRTDINIDLYRQRLAELDRERDEGQVSETGYAAAKAELDQKLLIDTEGSDTQVVTQGNKWVTLVVAVAVPVLSIGLYLGMGRHDLLSTGAGADPHQNLQARPTIGTIEQMVDRLVKRLEKQPNDSEGWVMLGRSYTALKRYPDAERAYSRAYLLIGDDPDFLADYAEIMAMNANNQLAGAPMRLLQTALKKNPKHVKSLWLSGHAELQQGRNKQAIAQWNKLLKALPPSEAEAANTVRQYIAQVGGKAAPAPKVAANGGLTVKVSLSPSVAAQARPDDTVFIFARAAKGPRMPLAITRRQVRELPITVTLDDTMAMAPQMKLSAFPQVVVGARVSRTGNAMAQDGDIEGISEPIASSRKQPVSVVISTVVKK